MEERLFTDDGFYEQMEAVKLDLLKRSVEGRLPPATERKLSLQVSRSPLLAAELRATGVEAAGAQAAQLEAARRNIAVHFTDAYAPAYRPPQPLAKPRRLGPLAAGLAAAALGIAGLAVLATRPHWDRQAASAPPTQAGGPPAQPRPLPPVTLFLAAGVERGAAAAPVLRLSSPAPAVELDLEVHGEPQDRWSVEILRGESTVLGRQALPAQTAGVVRFLRVTVPQAELSPGAYIVNLTPAGQPALRSQRRFMVEESRLP